MIGVKILFYAFFRMRHRDDVMGTSPTQTLTSTPPPEKVEATFIYRKVPAVGEPTSSILDATDSTAGTLAYPQLADPRMVDTIGSYRIVREVGVGGMGIVYEAVDQRLKRRVAIKMIRGGVGVSKDAVRRFQTEAEAVAATQHPNIVQIHEVGWHDGQPFVALEYLPGGSLYAKAANKPQPPQDAAALIRTLAEAMHHAHTQGVIHRDLKPANILFTADGTPKVTDFGAARLLQDGPDSNRPGMQLTQVGEVIGTPQYMAPEQARGAMGAITPRLDVYALGAVLYHLLTGRPPHDGPDAFDVVNAVVQNDPVPPRRLSPKVPRDLEVICLKALEKHPSNRYTSAKEMAEDLGRFLAGDSILAKPDPSIVRLWRKARRKPVVAGLMAGIVVVALTGFAGVLWQWSEAIREKNRATAAERAIEGALAEAQSANTVAVSEAARAREESRAQDRALYRSRVSEIAMLLDSGDFNQARAKLIESSTIDAGRDDLRHWEWHYLNRLGSNELWRNNANETTPWAHAVEVSPDGRAVMVSNGDPYRDSGHDHFTPASLTAIHPETGVRLARWNDCLPESAKQLVWRGNTAIVATTPHRGWRVFSYPDGKVLHEWIRDRHQQHLDQIWASGSIAPDGRHVAYNPDPRTIEIADTVSGKIVRTHVLPADMIYFTNVRGSTSWRVLVTMADGGFLFDPLDGREILKLPHDRFLAAAVDRRAGRLAILVEKLVEKASVLEMWNIAKGQLEWSVARPHLTEPSMLEFSPDGDKLGEVINLGVALRIYDVDRGTLNDELRGHTNRILDFHFSPDGRYAATASNDASVRVWDLKTANDIMKFRGHSTGARRIAFDPNGWRLYSGGMDGNTFAWDLTRQCIDGTRLPSALGHTEGGAFSGGLWCCVDGLGRFLDTSNAKMLVFDPATYTPRNVVVLQGLGARWERTMTDFALSDDGRFLLGPTSNGTKPFLWDATTGAVIHRFEDLTGRVVAAAINSDGSLFAAFTITPISKTEARRELHVWNSAGQRIHYSEQDFSYGSLVFDRLNRLLCGVCTGKTKENGIHTIDLKTKTIAKRSYDRPTYLRHIAISKDNRWIATIDHLQLDGGIKVDVKDLTGTHAGWMHNHLGPATGLDFSPDGKRLACVYYDDSITLFDVEANVETLHKQAPSYRFGDYAFPARAAFTPDGRSIMMNHSSAQISIWRTDVSSSLEGLRRIERYQEAKDAAYAFHLRAAKELAQSPDSVGFQFHKAWLNKLTPPNEYLKKEWDSLK